MTFSIIIPTYNAEAYLGACLDSIFVQPFGDYEVLCIDDGSTDSTPAILQDYGRRHANLRVLRQENSGMATARNRGLDAAQGDYILFVDSDDLLAADALTTLSACLDGTDIVCFNASRLDEATGRCTCRPSIAKEERCSGWDYYCRHRLEPTDIHFVCVWQRAYRRQFLAGNGLRFLDGLRRAEDDLFTTEAMLAARSLHAITPCLYTYRIRACSITRSVDRRLLDDSLRVHRQLETTFIPMTDIDKKALYRVLASNCINLFSRTTRALYGDIDREMRQWIDWSSFRAVCLTRRHRRLYRLVSICPALFRLRERMATLRGMTKWQ